jgi:S-DNA-T family DNA segregation ATPase FtsK/SpoIIIE
LLCWNPLILADSIIAKFSLNLLPLHPDFLPVAAAKDYALAQAAPEYEAGITEMREAEEEIAENGEKDEKYADAVELVAETRNASISMLQRRLRVGYNRAARIIETMEKEGLIGPSDGIKAREVYIPRR